MKIKSQSIVAEDNIKIKTEIVSAGVLDTTSRKSAVEYGEVIGLGPDVTLPIKIGDMVTFKSYGVDIANVNDKEFLYVAQRTGAIKEINPKV